MKARCLLCPRICELQEACVGDCGSRINVGGRIELLTYGKPCSVAIDPMEKKPLYHFYPGSLILSLGMAGCNLHCKNCQNSSISQVSALEVPFVEVGVRVLPEIMEKHKTYSVAYTYTEPLVAYEYVYDCAREVRERGFKNVLVTAGYINSKPLKKLLPFIDGINLDIKGMSDEFYKDNCGIRLKTVLETAKMIRQFPISLEITHLVIPSLNDKDEDFNMLIQFVKDYLSLETPLHFSIFFPTYKRGNLSATPEATIERACRMAREAGLYHVYAGNVRTKESNTYCSHCKSLLIQRFGYKVLQNNMIQGACGSCGTKLYGMYEE